MHELGVYLLLSRQLHTEVIISLCCTLVDTTHQPHNGHTTTSTEQLCSKAWAACFVSQQGLLLSVCAQMGVCLHVCFCMCACFSSSPAEICTSLSVVSPVLWPSLEVARLKHCSCLQGIHRVTVQAGGHEADVHSARTQTEAHQQKLPHMGRKQRGIEPHTLILSTPSSFLLHACMKRWGVKERQREERQHWFLLYRFRKPVLWEIWHWIINIFIQFWCLSLAGKLEVPEWEGPP